MWWSHLGSTIHMLTVLIGESSLSKVPQSDAQAQQLVPNCVQAGVAGMDVTGTDS